MTRLDWVETYLSEKCKHYVLRSGLLDDIKHIYVLINDIKLGSDHDLDGQCYLIFFYFYLSILIIFFIWQLAIEQWHQQVLFGFDNFPNYDEPTLSISAIFFHLGF